MNLLASVVAGIGMLFSGWFGGHHDVQTNQQPDATTTQWGNHMGSTSPEMGDHMDARMGSSTPGIIGKVVTVSGTTLTITGRSEQNATTTYTVDASAAKVMKLAAPSTGRMIASSTAISVSDIKIGDSVMVMGPISGTSLTATTVVDGVAPHPGMGQMKPDMHPHSTSTTMHRPMMQDSQN